jgi:hypothetical protein
MSAVMFAGDGPGGVVTVRQLKAALADWPELNAEGQPTEVWVGSSGGVSNPCVSCWPLNPRLGGDVADIILEINADTPPKPNPITDEMRQTALLVDLLMEFSQLDPIVDEIMCGVREKESALEDASLAQAKASAENIVASTLRSITCACVNALLALKHDERLLTMSLYHGQTTDERYDELVKERRST